ncbi:hypothetical protein SDC9_108782 [bioreactor metagenome]|uniref:Uncharacterized protein n=1 Tax=bioreactor metagenome TaxID=1076179 RepID=A0A645BA51_9ZZZZ
MSPGVGVHIFLLPSPRIKFFAFPDSVPFTFTRMPNDVNILLIGTEAVVSKFISELAFPTSSIIPQIEMDTPCDAPFFTLDTERIPQIFGIKTSYSWIVGVSMSIPEDKTKLLLRRRAVGGL